MQGTVRRLGRAWLVVALAGFVVVYAITGLPADPEGDTIPDDVQAPLQFGLLAVLAAGGLVALRLEAAGAALMALAAAGLGIVAAVEYPGVIPVVVTAVFGGPAVLAWLSWQHGRSRRAVAGLALAMAGLLTAEVVAAERIQDHYFGPVHPVSPAAALPVDRVEWVWAGGVTTREATVVARLVEGASAARLLLTGPGGTAIATDPVASSGKRIVRLAARGLSPSTPYRYTVEVDGHADGTRGRGRFRTVPEGPASFTVAVAGCARTGSSGAVFDTIREADPLLYVITGDLHYQNISSGDPDVFLRAYDRVLTAPAQAALYRHVPVNYMWDDHDYGTNDADGSSPSRDAARRAYRAAVPHHPLPAGAAGAVYHAFTVGRVRFVVTDTRSERTEDTMLGAAQRQWLLSELRRAGDYGLVMWVNPDPWIGAARAGSDHWAGYDTERRLIADVIAAEGIDNLVMLSGDAHMVAIDDGTNSDYATGGGAGFPVLHAAALDRHPNFKGGPYSEGAHPGAGQFGLVRVEDTGERIRVELRGMTWEDRELMRYTVEVGGRAEGH